jgi:hypothetical protein
MATICLQNTPYSYEQISQDNDKTDFAENVNIMNATMHGEREDLKATSKRDYGCCTPQAVYFLLITGLFTFFAYIFVNLADFIITAKLAGHTQCIRLFPYQYTFDEVSWLHEQGTKEKLNAYLSKMYQKESWWGKFFPSTFYPWLDDLDVGFCPYRILYLGLITWITLWAYLCLWFDNTPLPVRQVQMIESEFAIEEADSILGPIGNAITNRTHLPGTTAGGDGTNALYATVARLTGMGGAEVMPNGRAREQVTLNNTILRSNYQTGFQTRA